MFPSAFWPDPETATAVYERYFDFLFDIATAKFNFSPDRAEELVHEILLASLRHRLVGDPDSWLLGAITTAANRENRS